MGAKDELITVKNLAEFLQIAEKIKRVQNISGTVSYSIHSITKSASNIKTSIVGVAKRNIRAKRGHA